MKVKYLRKQCLEQVLAQCSGKAGALKKEMSLFDLVLLGLGAIVGTGVFILTTKSSIEAGPGVVFAFLVAAVACILAALAFAEFASMVPVAGSVYKYTYITMGEVFAWMIGWTLMLEFIVGAASVAVGWSKAIQDLLALYNISLPQALCSAPGIIPGSYFNLPACVVVFLIAALLWVGVRQSKKANNVMAVIKVALILIFIFACFGSIKVYNFTPTLPMGVGGVFTAAATLFFAYVGFDLVASAAEETKNPRTALPRAIMLSVGITTVLYILFALVATGVVPWKVFLEHKDMMAVTLATQLTGKWLIGLIITMGLVVGLAAGVLANTYSQIRLLFCMARDGLLPQCFCALHKKHATPMHATWIAAIVIGVLAGLVDLNILADAYSLSTLFAFAFVSLGVIILRAQQPNLPRPFRAPLVPWLPILGILINLYLMSRVQVLSSWLVFLGWMVIGVPIYFLYSCKHSKLGN
ncbi:MAG: hypothetical protein RLZ12_1000 [Bacillota bacterium]|jgi:APA family basic amino acid/polyamine antiporter